MCPAFDLRALSKVYSTRRAEIAALEGVTFTISKGRFAALVGPSGCGKSTLLRILAGLETPTRGEVLFRGEVIDGPRPDIGLMFQSATLLPWLTVEENVRLPGAVQGRNNGWLRKRVGDLLEMTGLSSYRELYPHQLSGGMAQRVSICRVLALDPAALLLDEPFSSVDEFNRERLNNELLDLWNENPRTVLLVTHSVEEAVYVADMVVVMSGTPGQVVSIVDVQQSRPRNYSFTKSSNFRETVKQVRRHLGIPS